jgi:hypothetical protein
MGWVAPQIPPSAPMTAEEAGSPGEIRQSQHPAPPLDEEDDFNELNLRCLPRLIDYRSCGLCGFERRFPSPRTWRGASSGGCGGLRDRLK